MLLAPVAALIREHGPLASTTQELSRGITPTRAMSITASFGRRESSTGESISGAQCQAKSSFSNSSRGAAAGCQFPARKQGEPYGLTASGLVFHDRDFERNNARHGGTSRFRLQPRYFLIRRSSRDSTTQVCGDLLQNGADGKARGTLNRSTAPEIPVLPASMCSPQSSSNLVHGSQRPRRAQPLVGFDRQLGPCSEQFRVQVAPLLLRRLFHFGRNAVCVGIGVMTDARHLPGNFTSRLSAGNLELVVGYFLCNIEIRPGRADRCKLIAKVAIQRLEPIGQSH